MEWRRWALLLVPAVAVFALMAGGPAKAGAGAQVSIVGGKTTSISKWPWQVAFLTAPSKAPGKPPLKRFQCGGSLIAPTMIITAGHCAASIDLSKPEYFSVIAGRTRLNDSSSGQEVLVKDAYLPKTRSGVPRYLLGPEWDVALVELAEPVDAEPVKLLGPDEAGLIEAGRTVFKTGWGITNFKKSKKPSNVLMEGRLALQPPRACSYLLGSGIGTFETDTQVCLGSLSSSQGACFGDSGGPTVIGTTAGYRLIGATSYGVDPVCSTSLPSVDSALSQPDPRDWIAEITLEATGVNPVGSGGTGTGTLPRTCTVARIDELKLAAAKAAVRKGGCRVGRIEYVRFPRLKFLKRFDGKLLGTEPSAFMLSARTNKVTFLVGKWAAKRKKR